MISLSAVSNELQNLLQTHFWCLLPLIYYDYGELSASYLWLECKWRIYHNVIYWSKTYPVVPKGHHTRVYSHVEYDLSFVFVIRPVEFSTFSIFRHLYPHTLWYTVQNVSIHHSSITIQLSNNIQLSISKYNIGKSTYWVPLVSLSMCIYTFKCSSFWLRDCELEG